MPIKTFAVILLSLLLLHTGTAWPGPEIPGAPQRQPIVLAGGTIHPVEGPVIPNGTVVFSEGRIVALGEDVEIPEGAERIDIQGKHVYPGLINATGQLGLVEISSVRATRDYEEPGLINPNVRAQVAINPDSELIPVTRANGVLLTLTSPAGARISGTSAIIQLDGWTWEDMTLRAPVGLHVTWPRMRGAHAHGDADVRRQQREERQKALDELQEAFEDAQAYRQARRTDDYRWIDVRWEAMLPVLDGQVPVVVEADYLAEIEAAVAFAAKHRVKLIIRGGYDAPHCAELLREHNVPVIVAGIHRLPLRRSAPYDEAYVLPQRLLDAGVAYCIAGSGRFDASNSRNLPYHAATAVAYGLAADEALKAITLHPARILGVADRVGSLADGKDATLIVTTGDPLETETQVELAFIQGRRVDLSNRHTRLWEKYQEKYRQLTPHSVQDHP